MNTKIEKHLTPEQYYRHLLDMPALKGLYQIVAAQGIANFAAFAARAYGFCKVLLRTTPMSAQYLDDCETTAEFFKSLKQLASNLQEDSEDNAFLYIGVPGGEAHNMMAWVEFFCAEGTPQQMVENMALTIQETCIEVLTPKNAPEIREILKWTEGFMTSLQFFNMEEIKRDFENTVMQRQLTTPTPPSFGHLP